MEIKATDVAKLRQMTGAGMMDCKSALVEANGDFDKAKDIIREKGKLVAAKRADRETTEGSVIAIATENNNKAIVVCLGCETDFVAKNSEFQALANKIADTALTSFPSDLEALKAIKIEGQTIHGRTRAQLYKGEADWTLIGEVKKNPRMKIPVIGNGDITSPLGAKEAFDKYGVDGVMIGRATYGRPWIFREVKHYLTTGELLHEPTVNERADIARRHLLKSVEVKGERVGVLEMRRHLSSYFKALPDFKEYRMKLVTENDYREVVNIINRVEEVYGSK